MMLHARFVFLDTHCWNELCENVSVAKAYVYTYVLRTLDC